MPEIPQASRRPAVLPVLLPVCLAAAAMPLTFTGTAVALPAISRDLGGDPVAIAWITNAFMLTFGSSLMAAGTLADRLGRKRLFIGGTLAFALASLGLVAAPNLLLFDLLRGAQGMAAAASFAGGMAALAQEFDGPGRLRAFSLIGTSFGAGLSLGPVSAGLMIAAFGWHSIFLLVCGFAALATVIGRASLRESRDPAAAGLDLRGTISFTSALSLLTCAILLAPERGWAAPLTLALLGGAGLLTLVFILFALTTERPMLDLRLFCYPRFIGVQLLAAAPAYGFVVLLILLPTRFIGLEGFSEITAGLLMIALSAPLLIVPLLAGQMSRWLKPAWICGGGLLVTAGGLSWLALTPLGAPISATALPMIVIGSGIGLPWGLMDGLAVSVVPKERAGMAAGIFSTTRVAGEGVALAVVSALLSALINRHLTTTLAPDQQAAVAHRLALGDLASAATLLPAGDPAQLTSAYGQAFAMLLFILAGITLVSALVVTLFLGTTAETAVIGSDQGTGAQAGG